MSLEYQDVAKFLAMGDDITSIDEFKAEFNTRFGDKELLKQDKDYVGQITGKALGSITTKIVSGFKELGLELPKEEISDKKVEEVFKLGVEKLNTNWSKKMEEIQVDKPDAKVEELTKKVVLLTTEKQQIEDLLNKEKQTFEDFSQTKEKEILGIKKDVLFKDKINSFKWKPNASQVEKKGFITELNERFQLEYDPESNDIIPLDKEGKKIPSKDKASTFKTLPEVLTDLGTELGVYDIFADKRKENNSAPISSHQAGSPEENSNSEGLTQGGRFRIRRTT